MEGNGYDIISVSGEDESSIDAHTQVLKRQYLKAQPDSCIVTNAMTKTFQWRRKEVAEGVRADTIANNFHPHLPTWGTISSSDLQTLVTTSNTTNYATEMLVFDAMDFKAGLVLLPIILKEKVEHHVTLEEPGTPYPTTQLTHTDWKSAFTRRGPSVVKTDGFELCRASDLEEGVIAAFCAYFVFNMAYPPNRKNTLTFVQRCILKISVEGDKPLSTTFSVVSRVALKQTEILLILDVWLYHHDCEITSDSPPFVFDSPRVIYVKAGEMVALYCPLNGEDNHRDAELSWTSPPSQEMDQTLNISSAEQRHRDLLVHGRSLEGKSTPKADYFSSVEEKDQGVYTCTRSYLYYGQIYNMTFTVVLDIQPKEKPKYPGIISPQSGVIHVHLGSPKVIDCKALMYSDFDEVFWFSTDSFVETNSSFPVFYNYTKEINADEIKMTASLVFKKVSDEDLLKNYTCKLQTVTGRSRFVTISLSQKHSRSHVPLALGFVGFGVMILAVVVYVRFKMIRMRKNQAFSSD
ncbi:hypothetical protein NQZ68_026655 [Dissostichus eleginoides]|nr:hypothetical protein NQZ68_026655 [Dissostichus eleginoides]